MRFGYSQFRVIPPARVGVFFGVHLGSVRIHNLRAMEEQLEALFSLYERNNGRFSLALFSIDWCDEEHANSDTLLCEFAGLLQSCARDTDIVARYSPEEFAVLMLQTSLAGAIIYSERLLRRIDAESQLVLAGSIVEVQHDDHAEKILSRADSALYSARANGYSCLYQHNGQHICPHEIQLSSGETAPSEEKIEG